MPLSLLETSKSVLLLSLLKTSNCTRAFLLYSPKTSRSVPALLAGDGGRNNELTLSTAAKIRVISPTIMRILKVNLVSRP